VLLTLDLGHLREYLTAVSGGFIPAMRIAKEWAALMQAAMIMFATVYRFYTNEARMVPYNLKNPRWTLFFGWFSFVASSALFCVIVWLLLADLPDSSEIAVPSVRYDVNALWYLVLFWVGYPAVTILARMAHSNVPRDEYSASWSVFKDVAFALLDVLSKGGLALFFVLKLTYVSAADEAELLARANVTHV